MTAPVKIFASIILAAVLFTACERAERPIYPVQKTAIGENGMVVSAHPLATEAGLRILRAGGNAIDAAIAVQLTLAVVHPRAGNIGGGGFLVYRSADGSSYALDFREKAPMAAERDMYLDSAGLVISELSRSGHLAAGVPGSPAGIAAMHKKFGTMPLAELARDAVRYAGDGFQLTEREAERQNKYAASFRRYNSIDNCPFLRADSSAWQPGDIVTQPILAKTIGRFADQGHDGFYRGATADALVSEMQQGGGLINYEDLAAYRAEWRDPIEFDYKGYKIISMPPPSSGGVALAQIFGMIEDFPIAAWGFQSTNAIHCMVEAERRAYADRALYLGDPDYYPIPVDSLTNEEYLEQRMSDFDPHQATSSDEIAAGNVTVAVESFETTHLTVLDAEGNAVALTTTLNSSYGNKVMVDGGGFFLNNEMDDFSAKPGIPNQFGLIGAEANSIEPQKRMLSSMTPTIIEKDGIFFMTIGTPGGSTIITSVLQVFLNVVEFGMTATESVAAPRFHHQWLPDEILFETHAIDSSIRKELEFIGHNLREVNEIGTVSVIHQKQDGSVEGAADPRRDNHAMALQ